MTTPANTTTPLAPPPAPPAKRYFYKELYNNSWYIGGKAVEFEQLDGNRGVLELNADDPLVVGLDQAAKDQVGGIVKINEQEYHSKKNRFPFRGGKPQDFLEVAPRADRPMGKAFRPPPPSESPASPAVLADASPAPAAPPGEVPQGPPEQPDFKAGGKFNPKTARAGVVKPPEPTPV